METKRINLNDETRRVDNDATKKVDNDSTKKVGATQSGAASSAGPMGIVVFGTGQPLELNGKNCIVENVISMSSGEAIVYKITMDGKPYVLKHYKINTPLTDSAIKVLNKIKGNPKVNVIHLYDFGKLNDQDYELMELAEGGTLNQSIKSSGAVKDVNKLKTIVKMIIDGLMQMHSDYRIIHQDIKPDNIYFRDTQKAALILADFGISNVMDSAGADGEESKVVANKTPLYAAPELTPAGDSVYVNVTSSIDYYALGITMLELWLGEKPFKGMPAAKRDDIILKENVEFPSDMSEDTKIIIQGLIKPNKKDRWGKIELDKWLKGEKLTAGQKAARFVYDAIKVGNETASNPEELAVLFEKYPDKACECLYGGMLKSGTIKTWLEKAGDKKLSAEIEKIISQYAKEKETGCFLAMYTLNTGLPFKTKGGKVCKTPEEIASALLSESSYYMEELKKPDARFYLYLGVTEGVQGKKAAYDFCEYFKKEEYSPKRALNHVYLKLQEEGSITIGKKKYYKGEDMAQEKDSSQIALIKKALNETDSALIVWLSDMYPDFLEETDEFTELPPWSQFFLTGLLPFLSYKELIPDWKEKSLFDLKFLLSEMPGRADLFEAYAKQGLPLTGHLPDDRGSTPLDFVIYNSISLVKQHGEKIILNLVRLLFKLGVDPNEKSKDGNGVRENIYKGKSDSYNLVELLKEKIPEIADVQDLFDNEEAIDGKIILLLNTAQFDKAIPLIKTQAEKGYPNTMFLLGMAYYNGNGITKDYIKAVEWLLKAAEKESEVLSRAQCYLGICYKDGKGVTQDYKKAVEYFKKSAEKGWDLSQFWLGVMYSNGDGIQQDYTKSFEWFSKAAEQGEESSIITLGDCYYNGDGVTQDYAKAVELYTKSAERGTAGGMNRLGKCYYEGKGVKQDDKKAFEWFSKSAELGKRESQAMLGDMYTEGQGVSKDKAKAVEWYKKAAALDHEGAIEILKELGEIPSFTGRKKETLEDGGIYEGDYLKDKRTGKGKLTYADGSVYEGDFVDGSCHGKGKYTYPGGSVYEGDFADDGFHGKGKMTWSNGEIYEGDWVDCSCTGKGKMTYPDGKVEEGSWEDGEFKG